MLFLSIQSSSAGCGDHLIEAVEARRMALQAEREISTPRLKDVDILFQQLHKIATLVQSPGMPSPCYVWICTHPDHPWTCRWCLPYAIIPGMPKSGTSELFSSLDIHPDFMSVKKEINIFTHLFKYQSMALFEEKVNAHLSSPNETGWWVDPYKYWIDGSAACALGTTFCMDSITRYTPATKSLVMIRDPYQRYASLICMFHLQDLIAWNMTDRKSEKFIQWLSSETYAHNPFHDNFWAIFYLLEMKGRGHHLLVIDNYDLAHNRNKTLNQINIFLEMHPFPEIVFQYDDGLGTNSFLRLTKGYKYTDIVPKATEVLYEYNASATLYLKDRFNQFICAYQKIVKSKLHLHRRFVVSLFLLDPLNVHSFDSYEF
jgi:hypothetical protein